MKNTLKLVLSFIMFLMLSGFFWLGNDMMDEHWISGAAFKICSVIGSLMIIYWVKENVSFRGFILELPMIFMALLSLIIGVALIILGLITALPFITVIGAVCLVPLTSTLINNTWELIKRTK